MAVIVVVVVVSFLVGIDSVVPQLHE